MRAIYIRFVLSSFVITSQRDEGVGCSAGRRRTAIFDFDSPWRSIEFILTFSFSDHLIPLTSQEWTACDVCILIN